MSRNYAAVVVLLIGVGGCSSEEPHSPISTDGVGGAATGGGAGGAAVLHGIQPLVPDQTGWVGVGATGSTAIQGAWFAFSDGLGFDGTTASGDCEWLGAHPVSECSQIVTPNFGTFPNVQGRLCTQGVAAQVINVVGESIPDYDNIWGGGIGLGLNATGADPSDFSPYDAVSHQLAGLAFDIDTVPPGGIRVELANPGTTKTPAFWGGDIDSISHVLPGHNELRWATIKGPFYAVAPPPFDPTRILWLRFHVVSNAMAATNYSFCISNLVALF